MFNRKPMPKNSTKNSTIEIRTTGKLITNIHPPTALSVYLGGGKKVNVWKNHRLSLPLPWQEGHVSEPPRSN
ncbi:hypothetical protein EMIT0133MI5_110003 [Bacillus velezensis]